jgi:hypothetical protein
MYFAYSSIQITQSTYERCWIPSTEGTNFEVSYKSPTDVQPGLGLRSNPRLDGIDIVGRVLPAEWVAAGKRCTQKGHTTSQSTMRLFSFGERELTGMLRRVNWLPHLLQLTIAC